MDQKFQLRGYLKLFMARLGCELETYDSLDSETLVPYQCVVCRERWERVRARFWEARKGLSPSFLWFSHGFS